MNEHEIRTMVEFVSTMDIGKNHDKNAIFDPLIQGFNIWATTDDYPPSWESVVPHMIQGAYTKKSAFVGTAWYDREVKVIKLSTDAYIFMDQYNMNHRAVHNRHQEVEWAKEKIKWVFEQISIECPPIFLEE